MVSAEPGGLGAVLVGRGEDASKLGHARLRVDEPVLPVGHPVSLAHRAKQREDLFGRSVVGLSVLVDNASATKVRHDGLQKVQVAADKRGLQLNSATLLDLAD